ncbi:MAG: metallophosphoesterase family protein [Cyclobacteriaceae bacterium]
MKVGLLSDTHGFLDNRIAGHFKDCDEIWHAGDIGPAVADELQKIKPLIAVFGNIDGANIRTTYPEFVETEIQGLKILMTHIAGNPPTFTKKVKQRILNWNPEVLICGHSHIAKVYRDPENNNLLFINPGAAGNHGFHRIKTIMKFDILDGKIKDLRIIELGKRGDLTLQ